MKERFYLETENGNPKSTTPNSRRLKIAYLALEIPALSATFVYNEILMLEKMGFEILPISVLVPNSSVEGNEVTSLAGRTRCLYQETFRVFLWANISMIFRSPLGYFKALFMALGDFMRIGILSHTGIGLIYRFMVSSRIACLLRREGCLHLHAHFAHVPTDIAMYASMISGISFSFTSHANDLFERGWLLEEKVDRARFAVTISDYNRRFLIDHGAPARKIYIVHCGVDSRCFIARNGKPMGEVPRIGALGRMVEKKGFDILIRACGMLKQKGVAFHLEIAGDGTMREELEGLVRSLDLSPDVAFGGALSHNRVADWLGELDLFVLPCKRDRHGDMDGIPVALMEAMLSGVPVISTKISGIPELVKDGETGVLADPEDPEGMALAIERILSDESLRKRLCQNAIRKVQSDYDLSKNVEKLSSLFMGATSWPKQVDVT